MFKLFFVLNTTCSAARQKHQLWGGHFPSCAKAGWILVRWILTKITKITISANGCVRQPLYESRLTRAKPGGFQ